MTHGGTEDRWLALAKRLQSIASTGAHYCRDAFDRERYLEIASLANEMLARLGGVAVCEIEGLFTDFAQGYATPKVDVRGALFKDRKILLVREASDGRWSMPGGFADVGKSASENIEKEIWEEASLRVKATVLYGIRHKAKHAYEPDARDFYKLFFLCEAVDDGVAAPGAETLQVRFFGRDELPELSKGRTLEKDIDAALAFLDDPLAPTTFD